MIRKYGPQVEADLAFRGIDLRDVFVPGSGLTWRRLWVLLRALPPTSATVLAVQKDREAESKRKATADEIRAAHERFEERQRRALAKEG